VGFDDPARVIRKPHAPVRVELRIPSGDHERLRGEDVVRKLAHRRRMIANLTVGKAAGLPKLSFKDLSLGDSNRPKSASLTLTFGKKLMKVNQR
jgi:hypothetical protein